MALARDRRIVKRQDGNAERDLVALVLLSDRSRAIASLECASRFHLADLKRPRLRGVGRDN
jgi:hypothetical protein